MVECRPKVWIYLLGPNGDIVDLPVYPRLRVCVDCGASDFAMPPTEMLLLREAVSRDFQLLRTTAVTDFLATV